MRLLLASGLPQYKRCIEFSSLTLSAFICEVSVMWLYFVLYSSCSDFIGLSSSAFHPISSFSRTPFLSFREIKLRTGVILVLQGSQCVAETAETSTACMEFEKKPFRNFTFQDREHVSRLISGEYVMKMECA